MKLSITSEDPLSDDALSLIEGSEAALREVYTADECFTFSPSELARPGVTIFVARRIAEPVGCVALCECGNYAEVKRLFVRPEARGSGAGRALMLHLEAVSRQNGYRSIRLETGPKLSAGVALYRNLGYAERSPFGPYTEHPASLFMEKML